jgi:hypothetical protein
MEQIRTRIPAALAHVENAGGFTLGGLGASRRKTGASRPVQDGEDLIALAGGRAGNILSPEHGRRLVRALEEEYCALTAGHLGPDFHPEFIQGDVIFALEGIRRGAPAIPALACGCVGALNSAYPRGMTLGRGSPGSALPGRLPVLPDKRRQNPLCLREAFQETPARARLSSPDLRSPDSGGLSPEEAQTARLILAQIYLHPKVLARKTFSAQATVMNSLIWDRLFTPAVAPPPLIHLDMTMLSLELMLADLKRRHSLLHALLEPGVAENLLDALDGVRGCWKKAPSGTPGTAPVKGSFFFWGIAPGGRLIPLMPDNNRRLVSSGDVFAPVPLEKRALAEALSARRILPGLFLSFAVTALARGLFCCGGVYQIAYLEEMRLGLTRVLRRIGEAALAEQIAPDSGGAMSAGFLPLRLAAGDGASFAAATLDILAGGGLDAPLLDKLSALPVVESFTAALAYHYEELIPPKERLPGWLHALSGPAGIFLSDAAARGNLLK